ncbi:MAG TPA: hypothetical protein VIY51_04045 [Xanthobacteraceae bacterium]
MTIVSLVRSALARKSPLFFLNNLLLGPIAIWLAIEIVLADGFHRSPQFPARVIALGCVAIFGYLSLVLGRRGNARLLPCFIATGLIAEVLVRALGPFGASGDLAWREPRPYVMFVGPENGRTLMPSQVGATDAERVTRFNTEGFRIETEIGDPKPINELRIFVVGGSTVLAGAPLANTIPGVIESRLHENGLPQARVYNFGVVSFVSGQELALLVHHLIDLEPDLVIAYDGGNDLISPWNYDPRPGYPFNFFAWEEAIKELSANLRPSSKTVGGLAVDSAVLQAIIGTTDWTIRGGLDDERQRLNRGGEAWKRAVLDAYARNIAAMCKVARGSDALFAAFFQPLLVYSNSLDRLQLQVAGDAEKVRGLREQRALVPSVVGARMQADGAGARCRFTDLSGLLEGEPAAFWDEIHIDNAHNQLIGRRIADELLEWGALRSGRGDPPLPR